MGETPTPPAAIPSNAELHTMAVETLRTLRQVLGPDGDTINTVLIDALAQTISTAPTDQMDLILDDVVKGLQILVKGYLRQRLQAPLVVIPGAERTN